MKLNKKSTLLILYINSVFFMHYRKKVIKMKNLLKKIFYRSFEDKEISYKDLTTLMKDKKVFLIDVRSNQEYEEGHLDGAINIPLFNIEKDIEKVVQSKQDTVILYCAKGIRSMEAKKILENLGYEQVYNLKGGIDKIWVK